MQGSALTLMDNIFQDVIKTPDRLFNEVFQENSGVPVDVYVHPETRDMVFRLALAGYNRDDIHISTQGDYLTVDASKKLDDKFPEELEGYERKFHGIKSSRVVKKWFLPASRFDKENIEGKFENGILSIYVKAKESESKKEIPIN